MRQVEASAPTREEAIRKALDQLGVEMYEVDDIKIVDEGSRGLFGFGARPVKVLVSVNKDLERPARREDRPQRDQPRRGEQKPRERDAKPAERKPAGGERKQDGNERKQGGNDRKPENAERKQDGNERKQESAPRGQEGGRARQDAPRTEQPRRGDKPARDRNDRPAQRDANPRREDRPQGQAKAREDRPAREERPQREPRPPREDRPRREDSPRPPREHTEDTAAFAQISDEQGTQAATLLAEVIAAMNIPAEVSFQRAPEGAARLEVKSEDGALLIGRKGATLGALQYLVNRMISQTEDGENLERVVVDVEGYLDRRRESLEELAREMAAKARETGRSMRLKPMSPQERRIIHLTLQEDPEVRTYSQGEALYRSVVISPRADSAVALKSGPSRTQEQGDGTRQAGSGGGVRGSRTGRRIRPRPQGRRTEPDVDAGAFGD